MCVFVCVSPSVCFLDCLSVRLARRMPVCPFICMPICLDYLSVRLSVCPFICILSNTYIALYHVILPLVLMAAEQPMLSLIRGTFILLNLDVNSSLNVKLSSSVIPFPFDSFRSTFSLGVHRESRCLLSSASAMFVPFRMASRVSVVASLKSMRMHI